MVAGLLSLKSTIFLKYIHVAWTVNKGKQERHYSGNDTVVTARSYFTHLGFLIGFLIFALSSRCPLFHIWICLLEWLYFLSLYFFSYLKVLILFKYSEQKFLHTCERGHIFLAEWACSQRSSVTFPKASAALCPLKVASGWPWYKLKI